MIDVKANATAALFVDFEHLEHGSPGGDTHRGAVNAVAQLAERLRALGNLALANVYADWERYPGMPAELKRLELDPRFVLPESTLPKISVARGHCPVVTMALDALQALYDRPEIDTFALVSGDGALLDLIGRLKGRRKEVLLLGFPATTCEHLITAATRFEALDRGMFGADADPSDTPPSPEAYEGEGATEFDWEPFCLLVNRLEQHLPFVSLKYLKNRVLTSAHGCENTQESKANLIREAIRQRLLETFKIPNPRNPNFATTACRLNRRSHTVRRALASAKREA